jgi:hypothetical protein
MCRAIRGSCEQRPQGAMKNIGESKKTRNILPTQRDQGHFDVYRAKLTHS